MPKYFIYARKSTDEDSGKQIHSIEDQIALVTEYCQKEDLEIEQVFTESQTAKVPGRPIFDQMLNQLKDKGVTGIVSWHPDRLARNSVDGGRVIYLLDQGIIQYLKFPTFWFENTPQGRFFLSMAFSQAKYYIDSLSENVARGMSQKAKRGEFPGKATFGYTNDKNLKRVVLNPVTAPAVKQALMLFSHGGLTIKSLALYLYQNGVKLTNGRPLSQSAAHRIVTSPFYYGVFTWKDELYPGNHPPLITKKIFDKNQLILKNRPYGKSKRNIKNFIFKGLIKCGECRHNLTAENHYRRYKNGTDQVFTYYRCTRADWVIDCRQRFINEKELISQVNNYISSFIWPKNLIDQTLEIISDQKQKELKEQLNGFNHTKDKIRELDEQINQLIDLRLKGILTDEELLQKKNELTAKKLSLKQKNNQNSFQLNNSFEPVETMFRNLAQAKKIRDDDRNLAQKAAWLKMTASNLILENQKLIITRGKSWARLSPRPTGRKIVTPSGFEPELTG